MKKHFKALLPHFLDKESIPPITNRELLEAINVITNQPTLEEAMQAALDILSAKFTARRLQTYIQFYKWFEKDPNRLWRRHGFLHCTQQNYLFRVLMVESGKLRDDQIELGYSLIAYVSPHQYLIVKTDDKTIAVDPWNYSQGASIGRYATGFGMKSL